jgi:hypothetical protein
VTKDDASGWYLSEAQSIGVLGGAVCRFVVEGYDDDEAPEDFDRAIANFLAAQPSVLRAAEASVFAYYKDCEALSDSSDPDFVSIASPHEVWRHVHFGPEAVVGRRSGGDNGVYISLECACDWEPEHGLQIVFKNGSKVNKVGPFDDHLTNSDAFADERLEHVIYKSVRD